MKAAMCTFIAIAVFAIFAVSAPASVYQWTKTAGAGNNEAVNDIDIGPDGSVYITGYFNSTVDFALGFGGSSDPLTASGTDAFVLKVNPDGSYAWTYQISSGAGYDRAYGVAVDDQGNAYATGVLNQAVFITKISNNGNHAWTDTQTSDDYIRGNDIVYSEGSVYVVGMFRGTASFDVCCPPSMVSIPSEGAHDAFLMKTSTFGKWQWTATMGSTGEDHAEVIDVGPDGDLYFAGSFEETVDFRSKFLGGGTEPKTAVGDDDAFVIRCGTGFWEPELRWVRTAGGNDYDNGRGITVDPEGNVFIVGMFAGAVNFQADFGGTEWKVSTGMNDAFYMKINADGSYGWTRRTDKVTPEDAAVDSEGNFYASGAWSYDADLAEDWEGVSDERESGVSGNPFVTRINADGTYGGTLQIGAGTQNTAFAVAIDPFENIYSGGYFRGTVDFRTNIDGGNDVHVGDPNFPDVFLTKLDPPPELVVLSPADGAVDVPVASNLVMTFTESVYKGGGSITVRNAGSGSVIQTVDASGNRVSITGSVVTIDLPASLPSHGHVYVDVPVSCFTDAGGNGFIGETGGGAWAFQAADIESPTVTALEPAGGSTGIALDQRLTITFNEDIFKRIGDIYIKKGSDDSNFETIPAIGTKVAVDGDSVTINPNNDFLPFTTYYVQIESSCFTDAFGKAYEGIYDETTWRFETVDTTGPSLLSLTPSAGAGKVGRNPVLTAVFTKNVVANRGNIVIKKQSDDTTVETVSVTEAPVTFAGPAVSVDLSVTLEPETAYYVLIDDGCIADASGNSFPGLRERTDWPFSTAPEDDFVGENVLAGGATSVSFINVRGEDEITVYTFSGAYVNTVTVPSGENTAEWTLTNEEGVPVAPGMYICVLKSGSEEIRRMPVMVTKGVD